MSAILTITYCREILFCELPHSIRFLSNFIKSDQLVKYLTNTKIQKYSQMLYKMTIFLKHFRRISNSRKIVYITISQTLCCWSVTYERSYILNTYLTDMYEYRHLLKSHSFVYLRHDISYSHFAQGLFQCTTDLTLGVY